MSKDNAARPAGPVFRRAGGLGVALILLAAPSLAAADATTEAQLRAALQTATAQIATLEDQVANLQASQAPNVAMIEALRAQLQTLQAGKTASKPQNSAGSAAQEAALAKLRQQLAARNTELDQTQSSYQSAAAEVAALKVELATTNSGLASCTVKNARLFTLGNQILDAYSHKDDLFAAFANHEPFTSIKRVELENIVQNDEDQLYANQIKPAASGP